MMLNKKNIMPIVLPLMISLMFIVTSSNGGDIPYQTKKVRLGIFKVQSGKPYSGTNDIRWWDIESNHIAIDDSHRIYVLDIYKSRVLIFSPDGALLKVVILKDIAFPYTNRNIEDGYLEYMIQVSADGAFLYITGGSKEYDWTIFDKNGNPVKKNIERDVLFSRRCAGNKFVGFYTEFDLLDTELNIIKHLKSHIVQGELYDTLGNTYMMNRTLLLRRPVLTKKDSIGRKVWDSEIEGYKVAMKILGIDGNNNVYVLMGEPYGIAKIDNSGQVVTHILFPSDLIIHNDRLLLSGRFIVQCDGSIYYVPPISLYDEQYRTMFLNKGEYAIYRFDQMK
jgi:hypothetical protein